MSTHGPLPRSSLVACLGKEAAAAVAAVGKEGEEEAGKGVVVGARGARLSRAPGGLQIACRATTCEEM